jgi:hypothetical protein
LAGAQGAAQDPLAGAMVFGLAAGTAPQFQIAYRRWPKDEKVSVWILDARTGQPSNASPAPVTLNLTNVTGQPEIALNREGGAFTAKDKALGTDQVLAGNVTLTIDNKPVPFAFTERDHQEQRQAIAYLLFTLSQVTKPREPLADAALHAVPTFLWLDQRPSGKGIGLGDLLGVPSEERVEVVVGRRQLLDAMVARTMVLNRIAARRSKDLQKDFATFADQYRVLVKERLPYLILLVVRHRQVLAEWNKQFTKHDSQYEERLRFFRTVEQKLKEARRQATTQLKELEEWQDRLFQARLQSDGLGQKNLELERMIRQLEKGR